MISFFFQDVASFSLAKGTIRKTAKAIATTEGKVLGDINFIFCNDEYLYDLNVKYLNHDYFTDVITFDYRVSGDIISGDIFISSDRVGDNAALLNVSFYHELCRVMIHGVLHLCGYTDSTSEERALMEAKENYYLPLLV